MARWIWKYVGANIYEYSKKAKRKPTTVCCSQSRKWLWKGRVTVECSLSCIPSSAKFPRAIQYTADSPCCLPGGATVFVCAKNDEEIIKRDAQHKDKAHFLSLFYISCVERTSHDSFPFCFSCEKNEAMRNAKNLRYLEMIKLNYVKTLQ